MSTLRQRGKKTQRQRSKLGNEERPEEKDE